MVVRQSGCCFTFQVNESSTDGAENESEGFHVIDGDVALFRFHVILQLFNGDFQVSRNERWTR